MHGAVGYLTHFYVEHIYGEEDGKFRYPSLSRSGIFAALPFLSARCLISAVGSDENTTHFLYISPLSTSLSASLSASLSFSLYPSLHPTLHVCLSLFSPYTLTHTHTHTT